MSRYIVEMVSYKADPTLLWNGNRNS